MENQLHNFLELFLSSLLDHRLHFCILRNHESLPYSNLSRDIDILVSKEQLEEIIHHLVSIKGVGILRMLTRSYVSSFYVLLPASSQESTVLKLDLVTELGWKGFKYFDTETILNRALVPLNKPKWL